MKDNISTRMKENYEKRNQTNLIRRMPVIIRLDGKSFHTFTKEFEKPFSEDLNKYMRYTTIKLCEEIQGVKFAYTQSDEISLLLTDYDRLETQAWFDNNVQKICSVSASIATAAFNEAYMSNSIYAYINVRRNPSIDVIPDFVHNRQKAYFDSRCFNLPREEVINYFIWRQQDWIRNSKLMLGQHYLGKKKINNMNTKVICEKLKNNHNIDWDNDIYDKWKYGNICIKSESGWEFVDNKLLFGDSREFYDKYVYCDL